VNFGHYGSGGRGEMIGVCNTMENCRFPVQGDGGEPLTSGHEDIEHHFSLRVQVVQAEMRTCSSDSISPLTGRFLL
jgi:hypothetical protein